ARRLAGEIADARQAIFGRNTVPEPVIWPVHQVPHAHVADRGAQGSDLAGEFVSGDDRQRARLPRPCCPGPKPAALLVDEAGGVDPNERLAYPGPWLRRLIVGQRLAASAGPQTDCLHAPPPSTCWPIGHAQPPGRAA